MNALFSLLMMLSLNSNPQGLNRDELDFVHNVTEINGKPLSIEKIGTSVWVEYPTKVYELTKDGTIGDLYVLRDGEWELLPND